MTFVEWMPAITAGIVVVGGALAYGLQKQVDQKNSLLELRRSSYQKFVDALILSALANQEDSQDKASLNAEFHRISGQMTVVASDNVLQNLAAFHHARQCKPDKIVEPMLQLILALRKDVFGKSVVNEKTLRDAFPISAG